MGASPWLLAIPLLLWGFGGGLAGSPVMSVAMSSVDKQKAGMVGGTVTSLASIGAGVGTAVLGVVYEASGVTAVLLTSSALAVVAVVFCYPIRGKSGGRQP